MKVTFICHSSFMLETESAVFLFDYFEGKLPDFDERKTLYIFASHSHGDHFNKSIFDFANKFKSVKYILSNEIVEKNSPLPPNILSVKKNHEYMLDEIKITTLKSTDLGVAFVIQADNRLIYHAGDLNYWYWDGEPEDSNTNMGKNYIREMEKLKGMHFDLTFIPLDPRLEKAFGLGMDFFLKNATADIIFPMHMWDDYSVIAKYTIAALQPITHKNQEFNF